VVDWSACSFCISCLFFETSGGKGAGHLSCRELQSPPSSDALDGKLCVARGIAGALGGMSSFPICALFWGGVGARRFFSDLSAMFPRLAMLSVFPLMASESYKKGLVFGTDACEKKIPETELKEQDNERED